MSDRGTLVTGFLSFGSFAVNPSALLAERSGRTFELLDVSFAAADAFVGSLPARRFDRLLLMGVAGSSHALRLERQAVNRVGRGADVRGVVLPNNVIHTAAPASLAGTLWTPAILAALTTDDRITISDDAGDYLCNYVYVRALQKIIDRPVGFLHVPPVEAMDLAEQAMVLDRILTTIEQNDVSIV